MNYFDIHTHHSSSAQGSAIVNSYPEDFVVSEGKFYSIGIHPWRAHLASEETMQMLTKCVTLPQVLAIGEVGIDKHSEASLSIQTELFIQQADLAEAVKKPLVIHAVKAMDELLAMKRQINPKHPWIIHGFRGNANVAATYVKHGFYLSIGEKFQPEALLTIPNNRLLLETDESQCSIEDVYKQVAYYKKMPMEQLLQTIGTNINQLFPSLI
ncbi:MAG: TatD family hydrolase [Bacteroides sp.]|nr:TatD family hydrolase [Bacteroides sp.]